MSTTPAFSPGPQITRGPVVGNVCSQIFDDLYEQCSLHITENIPSSVMFGVRPRIATARSNSSSVRPYSAASAAVKLLPFLICDEKCRQCLPLPPPAGGEGRGEGGQDSNATHRKNPPRAPPSPCPLPVQAGGEGKTWRGCWGGILANSGMIYCSALTSPSKKAWPSVRPSSGSLAFSGCGIRPRTVRVSLKMPAIARAEPLKFASSLLSPLDPQ